MSPARRQLSRYGWRPADPLDRPVLFVNPGSGGGKAADAGVAGRARERDIEVVLLAPGQDLAALVRAAVAGGDGSLAVVARPPRRTGFRSCDAATGHSSIVTKRAIMIRNNQSSERQRIYGLMEMPGFLMLDWTSPPWQRSHRPSLWQAQYSEEDASPYATTSKTAGTYGVGGSGRGVAAACSCPYPLNDD
jgi:hypothetical protein